MQSKLEAIKLLHSAIRRIDIFRDNDYLDMFKSAEDFTDVMNAFERFIVENKEILEDVEGDIIDAVSYLELGGE